MNNSKINALLASAYNLHVGPTIGGLAMTPARANSLSKGDKAALCRLLEEKGGSDLYSATDCRKAFAIITA